MERATEQLELPSNTYRVLEQMAQAHSVTPAEIVSDLVRQSQATEVVHALRQEYQRLADRALLRTITRAEEKRMDAVCAQINVLSSPSDFATARKQSDRQAEELIAKSEALLELARQQLPR